MAVRIKKRYARATRFRTIMSNNLQTKQTRREDMVPVLTIAANQGTFTFDRPVTVLSDAVAITGMRDDVNAAPIAIDAGGSPGIVVVTFPTGHTITDIVVPFEDPAIRSQIGAYVRGGTYVVPD